MNNQINDSLNAPIEAAQVGEAGLGSELSLQKWENHWPLP
jgi:hypothetical protein